MLWGVRINESVDDDAFYARTNAIAHELDPSRPTSGVRYIQKSSMDSGTNMVETAQMILLLIYDG